MRSRSQPPARSPALQTFSPEPALDNGLVVLVVDDDPIVCRAICRILQRKGHTSLMCLDSAQVIAIARARPLDAIFLDVHFSNGVDGLSVCKRLKQQAATRNIPVLMMTGQMKAPEHQLKALNLGAADYLYKPFSEADLLRALRQAVGRPGAPVEEAVRSPASGKVLVVDDDPEWAGLICRWMKDGGHEAVVASQPAKLLQLAAELQPDCIVLDDVLGGAPTVDVCKQLRELPELTQVDIIIYSAHPEVRNKMIASGADQFVAKSLQPDNLLTTINACVRRARPEGVRHRDGIQLDLTTKSIFYDGKTLPELGYRLFDLLQIFLANEGVLSRAFILERLPHATMERDHEVDVLVSRLRLLLKKHFGSRPSIETVHGIGYRWVSPSAHRRPN